jgi:hypothetical protein
MNLEFSRRILEKYPNIKYHENVTNGSQVIPCGLTDGPGRHKKTDMTELIAAFRNFATATNKWKET